MASNITNLSQPQIVTTIGGNSQGTLVTVSGQQHHPTVVTAVPNLTSALAGNTGQSTLSATQQVMPTLASTVNVSTSSLGVTPAGGMVTTGTMSTAAGVTSVLSGVHVPSGMSSHGTNLSSNAISSTITPATTLVSQLKTTTASPASSTASESHIITRPRLQDLVHEVDPTEQLDEDVEELLMNMADDFVESTVNAACLLAKHRKASTVEVRDVQLYLERNWNMWIPGFGTDELRPYKRAAVTEAHKQRMALIRKALKKY